LKKIPLTRNQFTLVDDEAFEWLSQYKWCVNACGYAVRTITIRGQDKARGIKRKCQTVYIHRMIMDINNVSLHIDHINRNRLDNRQCNLRLANVSQNGANRKKQNKQASSKHKGVSWHKRQKKWIARIYLNKKCKHLGYFKDETDAAKAYNQKASQLFGEFAKLNKVGE